MKTREKLTEYLEKSSIDAIYLSNPANVRYVSGYTGDDTTLVITRKTPYLLTDPRYTEQAAAECPEYRIVNWRVGDKTRADAVEAVREEQNLRSVAFEEEYVTVAEFSALQKAVKAELLPVKGVVEAFRAVKTPEEIACLRAACEIASRAFEKIRKDIRVGITEKELASRLSHYMVLEGADTQPYGNILISGARTSLLHGIPSAKAVEYGDFVLMDYGCQYHGYLSDMTRTVVVGKATPRQKEVYALEQRMFEAAEAAMKPGATGEEIYNASVAPLRDTAYFPCHYPRIGHSIGLFVHEMPSLGPGYGTPLEAGNVVTIEPGIYIPGWGGVRIEDQLLVTENGCESMISATRELIEL